MWMWEKSGEGNTQPMQFIQANAIKSNGSAGKECWMCRVSEILSRNVRVARPKLFGSTSSL